MVGGKSEGYEEKEEEMSGLVTFEGGGAAGGLRRRGNVGEWRKKDLRRRGRTEWMSNT